MYSIDSIIQRVDEFPTLPTIYMALSDVMANPRSTVNDAAAIISRDQSAAVKILKVANSSVYGIKGKITTISQAIFFIGFDEVKNLVVALSVMKLFASSKSTESLNPIDLWKHSIAVGVITRIIGKALGIKHIENYFVAGILHDIGKLFFYKYFNEDYSKVIALALEKKISIREAEFQKFGITHTTIGEMLAEKWKLPKVLRGVIGSHFSGTGDDKNDPITACVHLANIISHIIDMGSVADLQIQQPNPAIWELLNLPDNFFTKSYKVFFRDYEESANILTTN
ncbi:MAG: metal dependent phosphohydrolase [Ignavibacteria bacterium]|nr:metal dependent phosphohydrolase [Ignavibacteria bacterium]